MPYDIEKVKGGFKTVNLASGHTYEAKPITRAEAEKQIAAIHANAHADYPSGDSKGMSK